MSQKGCELNQRDFTSVGDELDARIGHAERGGDQQRASSIRLARARVTSLGLGLYNTEFVDERHGNKVVLGQFNPGNKGIKLARYEVMEGVARATGLSTADVYGKVGDHEQLHREIDAKEGAAEVKAMLTRKFNAKRVLEIEEGVVSERTSKDIDAYDKERAEVGTVAAALGTSRERFADIFANGKVDELRGIMAANDNKYDKEAGAA